MKHIIFKKVCRYVIYGAFSWLLSFIWKLFSTLEIENENGKWFPYFSVLDKWKYDRIPR